MTYFTYILRCKDGSLYTGITTDLVRRFNEHESRRGKGAKYTTSRKPIRYEAAWLSQSRSEASKLEYSLKSLTKAEKENLICGQQPPRLNLTQYAKLHINNYGGIQMLFICYPKCSTCRKAKTFLDGKGEKYELRDIKLENPSETELRQWHEKSGLPLKRFFNTSGLLYRELGLSKKLSSMSEDEQFSLLAEDGMLVKRPILIGEDFVLVGFKEPQWKEQLD